MIEGILGTLYQIYFYMVIVYILMSWLPNARESFIGELLGKFVEPYLSPFRRFIPPLFGVLDISPIVALLVLRLALVGLLSIVQYLTF
ncbi:MULTISPECIES: YggT family protein [Paenibacillus]|jgi:YggT family protein|nr:MULTISPECIES: YggT family protein [Paenibacillus]KAA8782622.1 YggT family protein [Paenibacillus amylolyticus]MBY0204378.1 YggT family protein [Paenibacillus cucumis (ex Kampfer et al. 2016)]MCM3133807.1 YggT family protein [Paenibacillus polysaccharolyticus]MCP1132705.1 YggT family protein [Paenibacillus polysaccharolyticus]MDT0123994.1 YggT family protein [Paenibacillus sp. RRE4]